MGEGRLPLAGLRVLEVATGVAAAYGGRLLAQFGADVVKVEPPGGDVMPRVDITGEGDPDPEASAVVLYLNAAKQSIVLDLKEEPRAVFHPTDMATIASLPIGGRVGEHDDFVPDLDDYAAEMFAHVIKSNWHAYSSRHARGPALYEIKHHFMDRLLLANAYVSEGTFRRLVGSVRSDDAIRDEAWTAAEIYSDARGRFRKGERSEILTTLSMDNPGDDHWTLSDGRAVAIPAIMKGFNSNECQLGNRLRFTMKDTMRAADTVFDNEIGYRKLAELQSFAVGLFRIGKNFQPSRRAGDMNLVETADFLIGELKALLGSAHLDPSDIDRLTESLSEITVSRTSEPKP